MARRVKKKEPGDFGELDGEPIEQVLVIVKGRALIDRRPGDEERMVLAIEGSTKSHIVRRLNGRLVAEVPFTIERLAEPGKELAGQIETFIRDVEEERSGQLTINAGDIPAEEPAPEDPAP